MMNQKITLRFADHVLTFVVPKVEIAKATRDMRQKWLHRFTRADGDFLVNFDQVLWMKVSPAGDAGTGLETAETVQDELEEYRTLFGTLPAPSWGTPAGSVVPFRPFRPFRQR